MKTPIRVLIAEDKSADAALVLRALRQADFEPEWERVETEAAFLEQLRLGPDIILSDYDMPQFSGPRALEMLSESGLGIPFIIISGTIGEDIAVEVMRLGASDYLLKDRLRRLGPAIKRALEQGRLRQERKNAEVALRQSEAEFRAVTEAAPMGIFVADCEGLITYTNATFRQMLGVGFQEVAGSGWTRMLHPEDRVELLAKWEESIGNEHSFEASPRFLRADGKTLQTGIKTAVMREHDRVLGYVGAVEDITDRKKAEEALRFSEARFASVFRSNLAGISITTVSSGRIIDVNERLCDGFGWQRAEAIGKTALELGLWADPKERESLLEQVRAKGSARDVEVRLRRRNGEVRDMLLSMERLDVPGETESVLVTMFTDLTERKKNEAQLKLLETCVARLNDIVVITDAEPRDEPGPAILSVNDAFVRRTGYTREEVLGQSPRFLQGPKTSLIELSRIRAAMHEWKPVRAELINYTKSGEEFWIDWILSRWRTPRVASRTGSASRVISPSANGRRRVSTGLWIPMRRGSYFGTQAGRSAEPTMRSCASSGTAGRRWRLGT